MTAAQTRELDKYAIDTLKIPGAALMRRASRHIAEACLELLGADGGAVAVFCGAGNNGGDGIGAAAYLLRAGVSARVFLIGDRERLSPDSAEMARRLEEYGGAVELFTAAEAALYLRRCHLIIDAIFGTGLSRAVEGDALAAVRLINDSGLRVVAADIPSGVDADTGGILGDAVRADVTVTFTALKPGHFLTPGGAAAGETRLCGIGIPRSVVEDVPSLVSAVEAGDITLPRRAPDTHKYDYGDALIIAGSVGFTGAPALAARAATRAGAGIVRLGVPEAIYGIVAGKCSGEIVFPISGSVRGVRDEISARGARADAVLIGPGLGDAAIARELAEGALLSLKCPVVLDADGINALEGHIDILDAARAPVILTPHDGEFRRIAGGDALIHGRLSAARRFAVEHGCVLILKGYRTITALPDGSAYINTTGSPALAKGGTGDILAG
ncbi:MAG: NAD(P)H-hydrate dehydratase, partial [Oscillospiraceae bacterium]|nr:NAD(P)H-hydrate dehydratase [Oscillospiraceae bacterium]